MSLTVQLQKQLEPVVSWEDITCLLWHNGMLFSTVTSNFVTSTACNGKINVWDHNLNSIGDFQAHDYGIYHMCSGPNDTIYTCASDSTICHWQCLSSSSSTPDAEKFKRLSLIKGHFLQISWIRLWEDDSYKGVLETYEEVWDMIVIPKYMYTVRNFDVTVTTLPENDLKKACSVRNTIPGCAPLFVSGNKIFCLHRTNFSIMVHSIIESGNPLITVLSGHNMMVNALVGDEDFLFSGDYEGKIIVWDLKEMKKLTEISLREHGCVNAMAYAPTGCVIYVAQEHKSLTKLLFKEILRFMDNL